MSRYDRLAEPRVEVVTAMFVAAGAPEGIRDLGGFVERLNNPAASRHIALRDAGIRPLYRAADQTAIDAALLVRRDDIVFANFDGPFTTRPAVRPTLLSMPVLLMAPPFQIAGSIETAPNADPDATLRLLVQSFFLVRGASVFDAEGNLLGEGEQIVVNGAAVQLAAPTRRRIDLVAPAVPSRNGVGEEEFAETRVMETARAA